MKIGPAPPQRPAARSALQAGEPARDFAGYLAESPVRAAGFAELGMFGLNRALAAPRSTAARAAAVPRQLPLPAPATPTIAMAGTPPTGASQAPVATTSPPPGDPAICALPPAASVKAGSVEVCSLPEPAPGNLAEIEDCAEPQVSARALRHRLRQAALEQGVSLVLREEGGAVEIVTGAPAIDPESRVRLRRLVEAILAQSGLRLAQFKLNGAPIAPDSLGRIGGRHGSRTR